MTLARAFEPGELIESLVFLKECESRHVPAELLLPRITLAQQIVHPAAAFARSDGVFLHRLGKPDIRLSTSPADLADQLKREQWHDDFLRTNREMRAERSIAVAVAYILLRQAGLRTIRISHPADHLVVEYHGLQLYWSPQKGTVYNGQATPTTLHPLIDGILFASGLAQRQQQGQVRVFVRRSAGEAAAMTATTIFVRDDMTFVRDPRVGELGLDIPFNAERRAILEGADRAIAVALDRARALRRAPPQKTIPSEVDLSPLAMHGLLRAAAIDSRMVRGMLIFRWAGREYSYDGRQCFQVREAS